MRKVSIIGLLAVHLMAHTEAGQLIKLPNLLSHFFQHHRQNPGINFLDFIAMHYGGDDGTSADDDMDSRLPCHNVGNNTLSIVYPSFDSDIPSFAIDTNNLPGYGSRLAPCNPSNYASLILHPPRLV